ncbi:CD2 antigen cytoplasmic tail-binding protein 2 homolog [Ischnura elegans]|uniref:CD2 antigen cytoplasmic tail-binding protein 2 homolog n=1 Tax=Ischnura elegans TaxID=197161 RepID=UPI001ED8B136|nr:CD2 antigen cytoplasmic tail-binding protein 2 homolog [Ischnura elegans]
MSKRKLEDELEEDWADAKVTKTGVKLNSLDSDEEDDGQERNYDILPEDEIEGQEDSTADFDGNVRITPFNMKEEMEEGHFDTDGNYHWKKEGKLIRDNWLDNIDWVKVKQSSGQSEAVRESDGDDSSSVPFDHISVYKKMIELMKPGETVAQSLRRHGGRGKTGSASQRWCKRGSKSGGSDNTSGESGDASGRENVIKLTELADELLTETGNMDVYQESFEFIKAKIDRSEVKPAVVSDPLDMYADDFDEKEKARLANTEEKSEEKSNEDDQKFEDKPVELAWEFKWSKDADEVHGPHTTEQMQKWVDSGHFKRDSNSGEVWVRKCGQEGPFYSSSRVDFELYL